MQPFRKWLILVVVIAIVVLAGTFFTVRHLHASTPKLSETGKLRVLNKYKTALIAQQNKVQWDQRFQAALDDYNATVAAEAKAAHMPDGTTFAVNLEKDEATAVPPTSEKPSDKVVPPQPQKK
jgi:nitrate/nitrite-specific signal transduction histidine kinase